MLITLGRTHTWYLSSWIFSLNSEFTENSVKGKEKEGCYGYVYLFEYNTSTKTNKSYIYNSINFLQVITYI